jgi:hypothetical protein
VVLLGTVLGLPRAAQAVPVVSSHLKVLVPSGGGLVDLFTFPKPDACMPSPCTDQRVMMAKFIVDETATDLSFELRSVTSPISKYPVTAFSTAAGGPNVSVVDNDLAAPANVAATVRARFADPALEPAAPGFKVLTLLVRFDNSYDGFPPGEVWKIQANATPPGDDHYYGFRVDGATEAAAGPLVTKPKLINFITDAQLTNFGAFVDLSDPVTFNFGQVHISLPSTYVPDEQYEFRNVGTAALNITAANPASFPGGGPFAFENYPSPPVSVLPMAPLSKRITFQPTVAGPAAAVNVTFTTNDVDRHVNLSGQGITLRSAILLDLSGSMEADKNGNFGAPPEQQKLYAARLAALQFAELYRNILPQAKLGLYSYPDLAASCPGSDQLVSLSTIDTNIQGYRNRLNVNLGHPDFIAHANGETPMAAGIGRAWSVLFPKPDNTRAAVFQIGDGQHSYGICDSPPPHATPEAWYNDPAFANAKIPFFTIPYGAMFQGSPTTAQFQQIASKSRTETGSPGFMFPADVTDETALNTQFTKALARALDLETLKDPKANITAGGNATHNVCVTESSQQIVFSVHWALKNASAVEVKVETPDHAMLTPASPAANPGHLSYSAGDTFADYVVRGKYLAGKAGSGVWKIHVKGNQATSYVYQVYAQDRLKTQPKFDWGIVGRKARFELLYPGDPSPILAASLTGRYEVPTASFNNYLATTPITPEMLARVPQEQGRQMALAEKKYYALVNFAKKPFLGERVTTEFKLGDEPVPLPTGEPTGRSVGERGAIAPETLMARTMAAKAAATTGLRSYAQELPITKYDGLHSLVVSVIGATALGECFEREYSVNQWADILLTSDLIRTAVRFEEAIAKPFFPPEVVKKLQTPVPAGRIRKAVTFTPVDAAGNYFGVGRASEITFQIKGAEVMAPAVDNLDGSYTQLVEYPKGAAPSIAVAVGDVQSAEVPFEGEGNRFPLWLIVLLVLVGIVIVLIVVLRKP